MKTVYSVLADSIFVLHCGVVVVIVFGWLWPGLVVLQGICLVGGAASLVFTGRCVLTDLENQFRKKAGRPYNEEPFLTYWTEKLVGSLTPRVSVFYWLAVFYYSVSVPVYVLVMVGL